MEFILYLLLIAAFIFSIFTSINVKGTFRKYNKMPSSRGMSAADIARQILDSNGLYNVQVTRVSGELTDHYDPRTNTVALSAPVYDSVSVGAIGVAAHEVGHAIQYAENYTPIRIRMAILPVAQFGSSAWILFFILGIVFNMPILRGIGIGLFAAIVLFQLITLPVRVKRKPQSACNNKESRHTVRCGVYRRKENAHSRSNDLCSIACSGFITAFKTYRKLKKRLIWRDE